MDVETRWRCEVSAIRTWIRRKVYVCLFLRPFAGEVGAAHGAPGSWSTIPLYMTGENIDMKHLCERCTFLFRGKGLDWLLVV
ncbi:hypothetical protein F5J12DRAFT_849405 [Pisolithus orientalis]|uniref:uncharacterized protein n=1 Tax=Pisolithus orientalis TaxID=936130 RepID=UPI0022249BBD|nr:uncharacterized protein F5J12DRAFT_849405 [Pisolithus orientalis]KAI5998538.1 hypothetical protein F5J12DRAFT_849405 [Pisolithus orientalis]